MCDCKIFHMRINIKQSQRLGILSFVLMFINDKTIAFGNSPGENRVKGCGVSSEEINSKSIGYLNYLSNLINITEQKFKKCGLLLSEPIHANKVNNTLEKINFADSPQRSKLNSTIVLSPAICRNLVNLIKNIDRTLGKLQKIWGREKKRIEICERPPIQNARGFGATVLPNVTKGAAAFDGTKKIIVTNEEPEYVDISLSEGLETREVSLLYASYANATDPRFECRKILGQNFTLRVTPNVNYLICLVDKHFRVNIFDCQSLKTKPLHENQPLLLKNSIPTLVTSLLVLFVLAMAVGASALYLTIHKNPSLIRGGKRVIEVKRQDKAHILIMPRGYESLPQADSPLALCANDPPEPEISTLSCDTNSTISYVSANQPTPVEILTYRLNRLKELFQCNNNNNSDIPQLFSSIPTSLSMSLNQRLPPDVDLLLEYEWYTIITTTTTTTTTTAQDE